MKRSGKRVGAYFTVEASLVIPIVIGSIVFIICFLLYWYNRCVMEQDLAMLAVEVTQSRAESVDELEQELRTWKADYMTEKDYAWEMSGVTLEMKGNQMELRRSGHLLLGNFVWKADASCKTMKIHPVTFLRLCRKAA